MWSDYCKEYTKYINMLYGKILTLMLQQVVNTAPCRFSTVK